MKNGLYVKLRATEDMDVDEALNELSILITYLRKNKWELYEVEWE